LKGILHSFGTSSKPEISAISSTQAGCASI
jgi:hypothetical protein